jgi:hypothetical protein
MPFILYNGREIIKWHKNDKMAERSQNGRKIIKWHKMIKWQRGHKMAER